MSNTAFVITLVAAIFANCSQQPGLNDKSVNMEWRRVQSSFRGANYAWFLSPKGELLRTSDGGNTWDRSNNKALAGCRSISFVSETAGWALKERGEVWHTTDGGNKWRLRSTLHDGNSAENIYFADDMNGWAIEAVSMWRTSNGGFDWQRVFPIDNAKSPTSLFHSFEFADSQYGWLCGERGVLYHTTDSGLTWKWQQVSPVTTEINSASFLDKSNGWVSSRPRSKVYSTTDGGTTWLRHDLPLENIDIFSLFFRDSRNGWAVGTDRERLPTGPDRVWGVVLRTEDGGVTWAPVSVPGTQLFYSRVVFTDSKTGWLVGRDTIYRTEDGGNQWKTVLAIGN
ncbi:MAG: YCF48-related protein [Acidobacteriota bacterium]